MQTGSSQRKTHLTLNNELVRSARSASAAIKPSASTSTGTSPLDSARTCHSARSRPSTILAAVAACGSDSFFQFHRQPLGHHRQPGQLLARSVVQILTDAPLLAGCDLEHFALQPLMVGDVAGDGQPPITLPRPSLMARDAERNVDLAGHLCGSECFRNVRCDHLAAPGPGVLAFLQAFRRAEHFDGAADHFFGGYPYIVRAPAFQLTMRPSSVLLMMASSEAFDDGGQSADGVVGPLAIGQIALEAEKRQRAPCRCPTTTHQERGPRELRGRWPAIPSARISRRFLLVVLHLCHQFAHLVHQLDALIGRDRIAWRHRSRRLLRARSPAAVPSKRASTCCSRAAIRGCCSTSSCSECVSRSSVCSATRRPPIRRGPDSPDCR